MPDDRDPPLKTCSHKRECGCLHTRTVVAYNTHYRDLYICIYLSIVYLYIPTLRILGLWCVAGAVCLVIPKRPPAPFTPPGRQQISNAVVDITILLRRIGPLSVGAVLAPAQVPSGYPVAGVVSSDFGMRLHPRTRLWRPHVGVDLAVPVGTPVAATAGGWVERIGHSRRGYGLFIDLVHPAAGYRTRYAHLSVAIVQVGQGVGRGQIIGRSGDSGNATGPHVHYEVRTSAGRPVRPR